MRCTIQAKPNTIIALTFEILRTTNYNNFENDPLISFSDRIRREGKDETDLKQLR